MSNSDEEVPNYYEVLCVEPSATKEDIRKAYRRQALLFHPDKMKPHMKDEASKHFQVISEAYDVLSDDTKRELYDRYGIEGVRKGGNPNPEPEPDFFSHPFFQDDLHSNNRHHQHQHHHHHHHRAPPSNPFAMPPFFDSPFGHPLHQSAASFFGGASGGRSGFSDHHTRHMRAFHDMMGRSMGMGMGMGMDMGMGMGMGMGFDSMFQSMHNAPSTSERPSLFSTSPFVQQFGPSSTTSFSSSFSTGAGSSARSRSTRTTIVNGQRTTVTEEVDSQGVKTTTVEAPDGSRTVYTDDGVRGTQRVLEQGRASTRQPYLSAGTSAQRPIFIEEEENDQIRTPGAYQYQYQQYQQQQQQQEQYDTTEDMELNGNGYDASNPIVLDDMTSPPPPPSSSSRRGETTPLYHPQYGQGQTLRGSKQ
ncbi:hypothetical protein BGZ73_001070 [Actinomortierella ambigua]|nr:hypothetical protein BGZ73_001070 [Actinomortierella ambigua]